MPSPEEPALLGNVTYGNIVHGAPLDADHNFTGTLLTPYALLAGLTTRRCSRSTGAVLVALTTEAEDEVHARAKALGPHQRTDHNRGRTHTPQ